MSEENTVHAELRENFGKGFARRLRAARKIPAVLYGHGTDPVHQIIEHIDLVVIKKGEKVQVDVPVVVVGESFSGTIVNQDATSVSLEVEATHIPQHVEVDVEGLEEGARITAGELALPKGASLVTDPEVLVVAISVPAAAAADDAGAEDEAAAGEGDAAEDAAADSE